jgi:uncharacterized protein (TIGR02453 family)
MANVNIQQSTFRFLKQLSQNNNRDWFNTNRQAYEQAYQNAEQFFDQLIAKLNTHDSLETPSGRKSLYRIYNDVRFSKDKSPYNPRFAGYFKRTKPNLRGGYYLWLKPGASRAGCGFTYPNPQDLQRVRQDILHNYEDWNKMLRASPLRRVFGEMRGDQVKTAPKGFPKDHEAIGLLRYKQYWFERSFTDKEVLDPGFINELNRTFKTIRPFFDYMSDVLTTDLNGESLS